MTDTDMSKIHWSFWLISGLALIWNLLGAVNIVVQMVASDLSMMPEWWRAVIASRPIWSTLAMMVAVFGGVLGCVFLLLKKSTAVPLFVAALLGTIITMGHAVSVPGAGFRQIFEALVMPIAVGMFLIWYARMARGKGWLG